MSETGTVACLTFPRILASHTNRPANMWPQDSRFAIPARPGPSGRPQYAQSTVPPAMGQLLEQASSRQAFHNLTHPAPNQGQRRKRASKPKVRTGCTTCKVRVHELTMQPRCLPIQGIVLPVMSYIITRAATFQSYGIIQASHN